MSIRLPGIVTLALFATFAGSGVTLWLSDSLGGALTTLLLGGALSALLYEQSASATPEQTVEALAEVEATASDLDVLEALPDPALVVEDGRIASANDAAMDLLGAHVVGQDLRLAIRHPGVMAQLALDRTAGMSSTLDVAGLGAADRNWTLRLTCLAPGRHLLLLVDQSLRQAAERMRVDFVANASHELRTPLAGILGFIETLSDPEVGGEPATRDRFLVIMQREARRMQRLVEDLLSLSRIEADKFRAPDQSVDLVGLTEEVAAIIRDSYDGRGDDIALDLDLSSPAVRGDRAQLHQLVHNLVSNALKYGRAGTPVTVVVAPTDGTMVRLSVTDEGEGIAPEHLPRLTERFYRVDASRSRAIGGTGLGLAIVKHIVERHRGQLEIDSVVGRGTKVTVLLPTQ